MVLAAGQSADLSHIVLHHIGQSRIITVVGFTQLEIDIGIIHQRAHTGILGIQGVGPELGQRVIVHQLGIFIVVQHIDLLNLMAGTESVKEMQERNAGTNGAQMRHGSQIGSLLDTAAGEQREPRLAAVHHVGMITKNGERMGTHGAGGHMQHAGQALAGDTVQRGDHQHQALRGGKAGGQRAGLQCTVTGTAGARLGLHLNQTDSLAEDVLLTLGRPLISVLGHGTGRRDGIDGGNFRKGICHICRGFVAVADLHELAHFLFLLFKADILRYSYNHKCDYETYTMIVSSPNYSVNWRI